MRVCECAASEHYLGRHGKLALTAPFADTRGAQITVRCLEPASPTWEALFGSFQAMLGSKLLGNKLHPSAVSHGIFPMLIFCTNMRFDLC